MSTVQRVAKNAAALYINQIVLAALALVLTIFMAREWGSVIYGKYAFAFGVTAICAILLDLGFNTLIVREVARDKSLSSKFIVNTVVIRAILAVIVFGLLALTIHFIDYPRDTALVLLILYIAMVLGSFSGIFLMIFRAFERMEYDALVSSGVQLVVFAFSLIAILLGYGLLEVVSIFAVGGLFKLIVSFIICSKKFARLRFEIDFSFWRRAIKIALPLGFLPVAAIICIRTDTIMLSFMKGDAVVGWYNVANNIPLALTEIPWIFMSALLPLMSASFIFSQGSLRTIYEKSSKFLLILGLPMAAGLYLLSDRIILLLYGAEFQPSVIALQILSWRLLGSFIGHPLSFTLISMNRERQMAIIVGISAVTNVVLNFILIPPLGLVGAAITTLISGVVTLALYSCLVSKHLYRLPWHRFAIKPLIACFLMGVFVYWGTGLNLFLLIILAAASYFLLLYLMKAFSQEDINMIKEVIRLPKRKRSIGGRGD